MTGGQLVTADAGWEPWAQLIRAAWQGMAESIVKTGRLLRESKGALHHGEWQLMVEAKLPFGVRTAQTLMKIAAHPILSNAQHVALLPPSWGTLAELTKVDKAKLQLAITDGRVHPKMERKDVAALLPEKKKTGGKKKETLTDSVIRLQKHVDEQNAQLDEQHALLKARVTGPGLSVNKMVESVMALCPGLGGLSATKRDDFLKALRGAMVNAYAAAGVREANADDDATSVIDMHETVPDVEFNCVRVTPGQEIFDHPQSKYRPGNARRGLAEVQATAKRVPSVFDARIIADPPKKTPNERMAEAEAKRLATKARAEAKAEKPAKARKFKPGSANAMAAISSISGKGGVSNEKQ